MPDGEADEDPVARVAARVAVLQGEIEQRNEELNHLQIYLAVHQKLFGKSAKSHEIDKAGPAPVFPKKTASTSKRLPRMFPPGMGQPDFILFVRALILEHGRPMDKREIREGFKRKGRYIGGKPELELKNLGKKLARAEKAIIRISGAGYWPTDVPCPEVSYTPP